MEVPIRRFYYGWVIVAVGALAAGVGAFAATSPFSAFITPMSRDLGWSQTTLNGAQAVGTLVGGLSAPLAGRLVDRYGPRLMLTVAGLTMGVALTLCANVQEPWQFFVSYGLARLVFQGIVMVATTTAVANWFIRQRGRATGLALMGNALSVALVVPLIQYLVETASWRTAWAVLGAIALLGLTPAAALLLRRRPEDLGLLPDGAPSAVPPPGRAGRSGGAPPGSREPAWHLGPALHTRTFWLLLASGSLTGFTVAGITTHQIPVLLHNGVAPAAAAGMVSIYAVCWTAGIIVWGFVGERVPARYGLALIYAVSAVAALILVNTRTATGAVVFALLFGLVVGGNSTLEALIWADYYGRVALGTIRGFGRPFILAANALGPLVAGMLVDALGSYQVAYAGFAATSLAAAVLVLTARPPRRARPAAAPAVPQV